MRAVAVPAELTCNEHDLACSYMDAGQWLVSSIRTLLQAAACDKISEQAFVGQVGVALKCHQLLQTPVRQETRKVKHASACMRVPFLHDSGSNAHLCNDKRVFKQGSMKKCNVRVFGINADDSLKIMKAEMCGDVEYRIGERVVELKGVLFVPDAAIGATAAHEPAVLASTSKLTKESGLSILFGDGRVDFVCGKEVVGGFETTGNDGLYVDNKLMAEHEHARMLSATARAQKSKPQMSLEKRKRLSKLLHQRIHYGKSYPIIQALRQRYGDDFEVFDDPCDACMWAKAKKLPMNKSSRRKAKFVGERLHFDLFQSPWRSDTGCKYLLVVVDEYSSYAWGFGLRKKSETMRVIQKLIKEIEKKLRKKVVSLGQMTSDLREILELGVSSVRCDNAKENVMHEMKKWCEDRGIKLETTIPHTPHQNGRAERAGGVIWNGGAAMRYGGNLPDDTWLHCCLAFIHVRNRLPNACDKTDKRTPFEIFNQVNLSVAELIDHFRTIGCICYVTHACETANGKRKRSFRAAMMGYADHEGKKGYKVQRLSDGKIMCVAYEHVYRFYEMSMAFPARPDYDAWLRKRVNKRDGSVSTAEHLTESKHEETGDEANDVSDIDDDRQSPDHTSEDSQNEQVYETGMMERLEMGLPPGSPPSRYETRGNADTLPQSPHAGQVSGQASLSPEWADHVMPALEQPSDDSGTGSDGVDDSSDMDRENNDDAVEDEDTENSEDERYEVESIRAYRRVGPKRNRYEYLTRWSDGSTSWQPSHSFRLPEPDEDGCTHIELYNEFRERMARDELKENEEIENEIDERKNDSDIENGNVADEEVRNSIANRIRVFMSIVRGGHVVPETRREAIRSKIWSHYEDAEREEIKAFYDLNVWELVPRPAHVNVVGVRWVYDIKVDDETGEICRYKARLVAQGFSQKEGIDYTETFAPTMHIKTARVLLALAAKHGMSCRQYDVSTAFLHASLKEEVYVRQPPGHVVEGKEDYVYRLNKAMYGLKNAPKAYSDFFMSALSDLGFKQSYQDECLWILKKGNARVYYLFHVDDILCVSNDGLLREYCFRELAKKMRIRDEGEPKMFLGVKIIKHVNGYMMSQEHFIESLAKRFNIDEKSKEVVTPAQYGLKLTKDMLPKTASEKIAAAKLPFQSLVGCLIYCVKTRPDVAYQISDVARFMSNWGVQHFKMALRILMYLYTTRDQCLCILPEDGDMTLSCYCDANWGDDRETNARVDDKWKSQYGYVMFLSNCPVSWCSKRQQSRSLSSMEAEYYAASEASKEIMWFRRLLCELDNEQLSATAMYEDNKACIAYSKNNTCHERTKHIDLRSYALRDCVRDGVIKLFHIATKDQLADMFTKTQLKHTFMKHKKSVLMGLNEAPEPLKVVSKHGMCVCLSCFVSGTILC